jgi:hypothetical protein
MKAFTSVDLQLSMGPLTREQRPASQSIKLAALMVAAMVYVIIHLTRPLRMQLKLVEQRKNHRAGGILALTLTLTMPCARGRPRRGARWYAVDSRRKRNKRFERAMLLAKRK